MTFVPPANFRQLPPVWEIAQPFHVDGSGAIASDSDPVSWARNHILALLLTMAGERVMRPTYGVGIPRLVWENATDPFIQQQVQSAIVTGVAQWEPNITIQQCEFVQQPLYQGVVQLEIDFSLGASPASYSVAFTLSGTGVEITR